MIAEKNKYFVCVEVTWYNVTFFSFTVAVCSCSEYYRQKELTCKIYIFSMKWSVQERLADNWNSSWSLHLVPCCRKPPWLSSILQASICMVKAEDAQALANSINLSIRDQQITASVAKVPCGKYMHVALVACPVETLLMHRKHEASTKKHRGVLFWV